MRRFVTDEGVRAYRVGMTTSTWEPALSASRAKEYERCPLQFRLHVVDRFTEPRTRATACGSLVHTVLEKLFDVPSSQRVPDHAYTLLADAWEKMRQKEPDVEDLFQDTVDCRSWLAEVRTILSQYFDVEDPRYLEPSAREQRIDALTDSGVRLRGIIDRIDRSASGELRVVDYKTGKAPAPRYTEEALYQMRFYALLLSLHDQRPRRLQLVYLRSGRVLTLDPTPSDITSFAQSVEELWARIEADAQRGFFEARRNPLCHWCGMKAMCPLFEGTPPELPEEGINRLLRTRVPS